MRKLYFSLIFLILLLGSFLFWPLSILAADNKELTQEQLDSYIKLGDTDRRDILNTLPQVFTEEWMDSVVRVAIPEKEAISLIIRQAVRGHMRDYLLIEGPKEVGIEIAKLGYEIGKIALTKNIGDLLKEIEKLTVKESVNYLGQWLKENEIKIATGNLNFSYDTFQNKKEKHQFQYVIMYSPETDDTGEVVIKIFSSEAMSAPESAGSVAGGWGTGWNYTNDYAQGKKIAPFVLTISGEMNREKSGYWQSEITHSYSWKYQPGIELDFPDNVPHFDFLEKGFFEKIGDTIKSFFGKIGDFFSGANVVNAPDITKNQDGTLDLSADSALGQFIANILEQFRAFKSFLSQAEYKALEEQAQDIVTEDDLLVFMQKIESLQKQLDALGEKISLLQAGQGTGTPSVITELNPVQNQQTKQNILINEVCAGLGSSQNEFIELYNPNDAPIDIGDDNFQLQLVNSSDNKTKKKITWGQNVILAKGYFLLIGGELVINNKKIQGDAVFSSQLSGVSGVIISDSEGNILDKVGWGNPEQSAPQSAIETQGKILEKGLETNKSLERSNHIDTNNNAADFSLNQSPSPANSAGESEIYLASSGGASSGSSDGSSGGGGSSSGGNGNSNSGNGSSGSDGETSVPSPKIVISEVQIEGETKNQDFIELYNSSNNTVDVSGWRLRKRNKNGTESSIRIFPEGSAILGKDYFLWASSKDENYPSSVQADAFSTAYLIQDESAALFDQHQNIIDAVAWGTGHNSPLVEGQAFGNNPKTRDIVGEWLDELGFIGARTPYSCSIFYQSLGRKVKGSEDYQDTNNNVEDFEIQEPTAKSKNKSFIEPVLEDILKEIDSTSPETEITSGPPLLTNQAQAIFIFHANEENCSFECKLDSQDWESCESPKSYSDLSDGQHKFLAEATDLFLNIDPTPAEYTWTIDTSIESPSISLFDMDTNSEFYTNQKTVGATVLASGSEEGLEWFLSEDSEKPSADDPDWQNAKPEIFALSEVDGSKTVYVWSKDVAGNISPLGNSSSIILDTLAPLSQVLGLEASQSSANFNVAWSGSDESGIAYYDIQFKDGLIGSWQEWQTATQETKADFSGTDSHTYYFRSRAVDLADNIEAWSETEEGDTFSYVNLNGPPLPEIISPNDGDSFSSGDDVDDEVAGVQIIIKGTARAGDTIIGDSQETLVDENNEWQIIVTLELGQNIINIRAQEIDGDQSGLVTLTLTLIIESLGENIFAQGLIISEIRAAGTEEFIELYNPLEEEVFLSDLYFSYFSAGRDWNNPFSIKEFSTSTLIIAAKEYFLIGLGGYPESESDWKPYQTHLSDDNGAIALFSCDPSQATTTQMAIDCKVDAFGWGEALVFETRAATSSSDKSLARKLSPDENGYLRYIDTNNNYNDFEEQDPTPKERNQSPYSDLDNDGIIDEYDPFTEISSDIILPAGEYIFKDLAILQGFNLLVESDVSLEGFKGVKITADNININDNAGIIADNNGYPSDQGPGVSITSQPGASYGGFGGRNEGDPKLFIYGDLENPIELGSGALGNPKILGQSPYRPGGAGGGAIILNIQGELQVDGVISSDGENGLPHTTSYSATGAGSGGSIHITVNALSGAGIIRANGGGSSSGSGAGGGGRIAIYYDVNNFTGNIQAFGGEDVSNIVNGGPGTVFISQGATGNLVIDNNGRNGVTILNNDSYIFGDMVVKGGANFYLPSQLTCANFNVQNGAVLVAPDDAAINISNVFNLNQSQLIGQNQKIVTIEGDDIILEDSEIRANVLIQADSLTIDSNSAILSTGLGYLSEQGPGAGIIVDMAWGGSYGGLGGRNYIDSGSGQPYGSEEMPDDFGSGGGNAGAKRKGGNGGGKIEIIIAGEIVIDGVISSNGDNGLPHITSYSATGAGSGGTVYLSANIIEGAGAISANGGSASSAGGGGAGGRVAVYGNTDNFVGVAEALGGKNSDNVLSNGEDGTVFLGL